MRMRSALFVFMPLAVLLAGCPVWGSNGEGGGGNPATCRTNGDCRSGFYCEDATDTCVPSPSCRNESDCGSTQNCDFRDTCVPDVPGACESNGDCASSQVCVEGFCHVASNGADNEVCQFNYECGGGKLCINNVCTSQCASESACGSGQTCTNSVCVTKPNECDTSDDCSGAEHCVDGRCFQDCRGTNTCTNAQDACNDEDDFCHPGWQPSGFCNDNSQCSAATGSVCDTADHVCRVKCGGCTVDNDCRPNGSGTATCNIGTHLCEFDSGDPDATSTAAEFCQLRDVQLATCDAGDGYCHTASEGSVDCQVQANCDAGQSCIDGQCVTP